MNIKSEADFEYDVALSFAGEDRSSAQQLAQLLERQGVKVFYDKAEQANLWGKDLYQHLADIYSNRARFCVLFISSNYVKKAWTQHEIRNAQARAFRSGEDYILPLRLDDTAIPGIPETVGHIDLRHTSLEDVADLIKEKLGSLTNSAEPASLITPIPKTSSSRYNIPLPKVKRQFSDYEKGQFLKESFEFIREYFQHALSALKAQYPEVSVDFTEIHNRKFVCMVYFGGKLKSQCKIWIGGGIFSSDSICYSEGKTGIDSDNSYNDLVAIEDNGDELLLRSMMGQLYQPDGKSVMSMEKASEYLWKRFTAVLTY